MPDPDLYAQEILNISSKTIDTIDWLYQGQYAFDMPYGVGSMTYKKSTYYSKFYGSWFHGKFYDGTLIYKNGDSFEGLFRDGRRYYGTLTFSNGGDLLESKETRRQCLARLISNSENVKSDLICKEFKGAWQDEQNSEGTLWYESGSKYVG